MKSNNINDGYKNEGEISLRELILKIKQSVSYLLSRWLIILGIGIFGGICGIVYVLFKDVTYTATTTFVLENNDRGSPLGQYAGLASMVGVDVGGNGGGIFQGDNILELYKSRNMIQKALLSQVNYNGESKTLIDLYIGFKKLRKKWKDVPELKNIQFSSKANSQGNVFTRLQDSILGKIVDDINRNFLVVSKPDKKLSIIKVEVNAKDEFFAKAFNDQIVKNVNDFYIQTKTKKSLDNIAILQKKTDSVRREMTGAIYSAAAISDATPNLNPTRQVQRAAPMQKSQYAAETNKTILAELVKNLEMSKMSLLKETPLVQVVDQPVFPLTTNKLGKAMGGVVGGILFGLVAVVIIIFRKIVSDLN
jgi:uncharacterized protein involved in exopolysaccharide biosynthesis